MSAEPYNEAEVVAELADGRHIDVCVKNFGWQGDHYLTQFEFEGAVITSMFHCDYHEPSLCPVPAMREATDLARLQDEVWARLGEPLHELIV